MATKLRRLTAAALRKGERAMEEERRRQQQRKAERERETERLAAEVARRLRLREEPGRR